MSSRIAKEELNGSDQLVESWQIHNRISLFLLAAIKPQQLEISGSKGRTVGQLFAHLHNVRLMWLKSAGPDLLDGVGKLDPEKLTHEGLSYAIEASGRAIELLLRRALESGERIKGFKPHTAAFLCYLIAHEAHHRGQAMILLRLAGQPLDKKISYGMWEWGSR